MTDSTGSNEPVAKNDSITFELDSIENFCTKMFHFWNFSANKDLLHHFMES